MKKAMAGAALAAGELAKTPAGQKAISQGLDTTARASKILGWTFVGLIGLAGAYLLYKVISKAISKGQDNADERAAIKEEQQVLAGLDKGSEIQIWLLSIDIPISFCNADFLRRKPCFPR